MRTIAWALAGGLAAFAACVDVTPPSELRIAPDVSVDASRPQDAPDAAAADAGQPEIPPGALPDAGGGSPPDSTPDRSGAIDQAPPPPGLVGWWKLDEGTGTTAADFLGGPSGTLSAGAGWSASVAPPVAGPEAHAVSFDGATGYVQIPRDPAFEPPAFTVAFWVKRDGAQAQFAQLVFKDWRSNAAPSYASYAIQLSPVVGKPDLVEFVTGHAGGFDSLSVAGAVPDLTWVHIAAVCDPAGAAPQKLIYIDGVAKASKTLTLPVVYDTNGKLYVGGWPPATSQAGAFKGWVDSVRIYNRALTAPEIAALAGK